MPLTRSLIESTVVITGGSSGIGAATALTLAGRGARLVLAARSPCGLAYIGERCRGLGAPVLEVPTDTADPDAVERLAAAAQAEYGRIDAWGNNAGVAVYGRLLDLPLDQVHRTVDVDVFGYLHGARAAVPRLRAAGGGVLIMVGSVLSEVSLPYLGAYTMSKAWRTRCVKSCTPTGWTRCPCAR
jgi:NAD(P)-dependent dehydrogenase (short-subunit alcohol dehydrogenase family)